MLKFTENISIDRNYFDVLDILGVLTPMEKHEQYLAAA